MRTVSKVSKVSKEKSSATIASKNITAHLNYRVVGSLFETL